LKIIFATNNQNKLREIQHALGDSFELLSLRDVQFSGDIPETGETLEENALQKAGFIADRFDYPVFADDTGLEIDALNGCPGVHTAHYSGSRDSEKNMDKVLKEMGDTNNRTARFRTVIAFVKGGKSDLFEGKVEGSIALRPSGDKGFGYDPIFIPEGQSRTFAEMTMEEKSQQNHRVRALRKFIAYLSGLQTQSSS
jgi:XTP/dITP diphosphohydrolase